MATWYEYCIDNFWYKMYVCSILPLLICVRTLLTCRTSVYMLQLVISVRRWTHIMYTLENARHLILWNTRVRACGRKACGTGHLLTLGQSEWTACLNWHDRKRIWPWVQEGTNSLCAWLSTTQDRRIATIIFCSHSCILQTLVALWCCKQWTLSDPDAKQLHPLPAEQTRPFL